MCQLQRIIKIAFVTASILIGYTLAAAPVSTELLMNHLSAQTAQPLGSSSSTKSLSAPPISRAPQVKSAPSQSPSSQAASVTHKQILNLKDADIRAVIQTVSLLTGKNFIIDPRVQGKITLMSQKPMSTNEIYQVFLSMLQVLGYSAVSSGHAMKVVPIMDAKELGGRLATYQRPGVGDEIVVRVVPIAHVSAVQLVPILRPLLAQSATISVYSPSNTIILAGSAASINRAVKIVHQMDTQDQEGITLVKLKFASAKNVAAVISKLQSARQAQGQPMTVALSPDTDNNSILISGELSSRYQLRSLIRQLDVKSTGSSGNTVVIHLNYLDAKKLAPLLGKVATGTMAGESSDANQKGTAPVGGVARYAAGRSYPTHGSGGANGFASDDSGPSGFSAKGISVQAEESSNSIVIHAPHPVIQSLLQVVRQLDLKPGQVLVEAVIVKVNESLLDQLGIQWGTVDSKGEPTGSGKNSFELKVNHGIGVINGGDLAAIVNVLANNSSSDVLATPSVVVLNNKPAIIADGQNVGLTNRTYAQDSTDPNNQGVPFTTVERTDVTLQLKVTPQISPNHMLRLKIDQQDKRVDPATNQSNSNDPSNLTLDVSKLKTSVLVHSGDVLVLGGLIDNEQIEEVNKIPILGDIPLLGYFFKTKSKTEAKKNLMLFIRPTILGDRAKSIKESMKHYNYMRYQQLKARSGHWLRREGMPLLPAVKKKHASLLTLPSPQATRKS